MKENNQFTVISAESEKQSNKQKYNNIGAIREYKYKDIDTLKKMRINKLVVILILIDKEKKTISIYNIVWEC